MFGYAAAPNGFSQFPCNHAMIWHHLIHDQDEPHAKSMLRRVLLTSHRPDLSHCTAPIYRFVLSQIRTAFSRPQRTSPRPTCAASAFRAGLKLGVDLTLRATARTQHLLLAAIAPSLASCDRRQPRRRLPTDSRCRECQRIITVEAAAARHRARIAGRIAPPRCRYPHPVSGIVIERLFQQGAEVKAGDPVTDRSATVRSRGAVERCRAGQGTCRVRARRSMPIGIDSCQPARDAGGRESKRRSARCARLQPISARARPISRAHVSISTTRPLRAPIDGVGRRALVSEGALVVQNDRRSATIQQLDPIYADFTQSISE